MPVSVSNRKGHYSCEFCRARKLRCSRPLPCTNCVSRGKTCRFGTTIATTVTPNTPTIPAPQQQPVSTTSSDQRALLAEVQALKSLAQDLETRVVQSTSHTHNLDFSQSPSTSGSPSSPGPLPTFRQSQVSEVVDNLERVSMGQCSHKPIHIDDNLVFKVQSICTIPQAPSYIYTVNLDKYKPTQCVWLPRHDEARVLLDQFITNISYIYHVMHHPSLPTIVDDVYRQIGNSQEQEILKPGHLVLLLSIVASATHVWAPDNDDEIQIDGESGGSQSLFSSSVEASTQTPLWIKATLEVLNIASQNTSDPALETIQGIIVLSFLICNLEGFSLRYRSLISKGLFLSRELGLHCIDHRSNSAAANTLQAEIGRRVWWYLVATDWILATRHGGPNEGVYQTNPRHMVVRKPRNINDVDLLDNGLHLDLPISEPTEMAYFLQRIRLAEISRNIVDQNPPMTRIGSGGPNYYAHVMAVDFELDQLFHHIPPFFHLDNYDEHSLDSKTSKIFIQAYLFNSMFYTQRCKLHLPYLTSGPNKNNNNNQAYASSRETCLKSAKQLIRAEAQLGRSQHAFMQIRLRLSAVLYGVFLASIVLLMDTCVNTTISLQDEIRGGGELAEALRMVEDAKRHSLAAVNLHELLTQVLAKHRAHHQQGQQQQPQNRQHIPQAPVELQMGGVSAPAMNTLNMPQNLDLLALAANPTSVDVNRSNNSISSIPDQQPSVASSQPAYGSELAQNFEEIIDLDGFPWDDLFSDLGSSSFF